MTSPLTAKVTTSKGMSLPDWAQASAAARSRPPQQGTSMRATVTEVMSLAAMMAASLSV